MAVLVVKILKVVQVNERDRKDLSLFLGFSDKLVQKGDKGFSGNRIIGFGKNAVYAVERDARGGVALKKYKLS